MLADLKNVLQRLDRNPEDKVPADETHYINGKERAEESLLQTRAAMAKLTGEKS